MGAMAATRATTMGAARDGRGSATTARAGRRGGGRGGRERRAGRANANANANANATDERAATTAMDAIESLRPTRGRDGTKMLASVSTAAGGRAREGTRGDGASAAAGAGVVVVGGGRRGGVGQGVEREEEIRGGEDFGSLREDY